MIFKIANPSTRLVSKSLVIGHKQNANLHATADTGYTHLALPSQLIRMVTSGLARITVKRESAKVRNWKAHPLFPIAFFTMSMARRVCLSLVGKPMCYSV
ncbi:jg14523 [Pararge aegeria aegeria]|uniref:Jg14523 protein n=1 Tax=Pararge aegeria aegeria TaxID=348720 RepID=A0A8S4QAZ3_9NEOP|nr:jg14523 [Pararge aegeria aegeria]